MATAYTIQVDSNGQVQGASGVFNDLGVSFLTQFQRTGDLTAIGAAISALEKAVELTPLGHTDLARRLSDLGVALQTRFNRIGDIIDIDRAISVRQRAVELAPPGSTLLPVAYNNLGISLQARFHCTGDLANMQGAISAKRKAVELTPPDNAVLPVFLNNLGNALQRQFQDTNDLADIEEAISVYRKVVELTPPNQSYLSSVLGNLSGSLEARFERTGDISDIKEAISTARKAVGLTPPGHTHLLGIISNLGLSIRTLFNRTGNLADIEEVLSIQRRIVELTPPDHANLPARLTDLGNSLIARFGRTGDHEDIEEAIITYQNAIRLTPPGHTKLSVMLSNLGVSFEGRFKRTGNVSDIDEAISAQRRAAGSTPPGDASLPHILGSLGNTLQTRFDCTGDLADLEEVISVKQKTIELTPPDHPALPRRLTHLGIAFQTRFEHTEDLADIQEAISVTQKAVALTPPDHADLPTMLTNLGSSFQARFRRIGEIADIQEAIYVQREAVKLTPSGHANLPARLNDLGNSLQIRFKRTRDPADIHAAISGHQKAVDLASQDHGDLPRWLSNLGNSHRDRFRHTGERADIEDAISAHQKAVRLTPPGNARLHIRYTNLGISFHTQFECTGALADIDEAISAHRKAVELAPPGHANLSNCLNNLGMSLRVRSIHTKNDGDVPEALACFRRAAESPTGNPSSRLGSARNWARLCWLLDPPQSLRAFAKGIELLSLVAGLELTLHNRHQNLVASSDLSLEAAAAAFSLGETERALEWLEQGRCIVWTQLNNLRTPFDSLRVHDQALADRILDISKSLEKAGSSTTLYLNTEESMEQKMAVQSGEKHRVELAQEWDRLLAKVREIPGFETFLLPTPASVLLDGLPVGGPTIIINVDKERCDALALYSKPRKCIHIPLRSFSYTKALGLRKRMRKSLDNGGLRVRGFELEPDIQGELQVKANAVEPNSRGIRRADLSTITILKTVLSDLWVDVAKPIIDCLGFSPSTQSMAKPRVWWCTTGSLASLPLHAAGIYDRPDCPKLSDFVISSYTPSVGALVQRANDPTMASGSPRKMFMVSQPSTPGLSPIPATTNEVLAIEKRLVEHGVPYLTLEGEHASVEAGMTMTETHSSVHFACHAEQNLTDPLRSAFFFYDGPLELSRLIGANLKNADFAFLSACQTGKGDENLSEEAIHLAAGMLAAGYRGVVATMWSIRDDCAPKIADLFYEELLACEVRAGRNGLNGAHAAYALDHAIQEFRRSLPDTDFALLTWIPYVHIGL